MGDSFRTGLRHIRERHNLTVGHLAERCAQAGAGHITENVIWNIESARRSVSVDIAVAVAVVLNEPLTDLMFPDPEATISLTSRVHVKAATATAWITGQICLPHTDIAAARTSENPSPPASDVDLDARLAWLAENGHSTEDAKQAVIDLLDVLADTDSPHAAVALTRLRMRLGIPHD